MSTRVDLNEQGLIWYVINKDSNDKAVQCNFQFVEEDNGSPNYSIDCTCVTMCNMLHFRWEMLPWLQDEEIQLCYMKMEYDVYVPTFKVI